MKKAVGKEKSSNRALRNDGLPHPRNFYEFWAFFSFDRTNRFRLFDFTGLAASPQSTKDNPCYRR